MTAPVHWPWLHGPADAPDPRVGEMSASAAHRHRPGVDMWDYWLHQPVRELAELGLALHMDEDVA